MKFADQSLNKCTLFLIYSRCFLFADGYHLRATFFYSFNSANDLLAACFNAQTSSTYFSFLWVLTK